MKPQAQYFEIEVRGAFDVPNARARGVAEWTQRVGVVAFSDSQALERAQRRKPEGATFEIVKRSAPTWSQRPLTYFKVVVSQAEADRLKQNISPGERAKVFKRAVRAGGASGTVYAVVVRGEFR